MSSTIWVASSRVGASTSAAGRGRVGGDPVDHGTPKASVLPGAGRRLREHVAPGEDVADHVALDRERFSDALLGQGADDSARHAEIGEGLR